MRAVIMHAPGNVTVEDMPMPTILEPTDAIIKLAATCICGSDLWSYRGAQPVDHRAMGHEYIGEVVEVGSEVTTVAPGELRCRLLLHLLRRMRNLHRRLPLPLPQGNRSRRRLHRRTLQRHPGRIRPRTLRRWHPRQDPLPHPPQSRFRT